MKIIRKEEYELELETHGVFTMVLIVLVSFALGLLIGRWFF